MRIRVLVPTGVIAMLGIGAYAFAFSGTPSGGEQPFPPHKPAPAATPTANVKRAAWAKQANTICANLNDETHAIPVPQSRTELVTRLPLTLDAADKAIAALQEVPVPKADAKDVKRMLALYTRFVAVERQAVTALQGGDVAKFAELTGTAFRANDRGNTIARTLGANQCAVGGTDDTALAHQLRKHKVVVAVLYSPDAPLDRLAIAEARAGALMSGAGFVSVDVYDAKAIAPLAAEYSIREAPAVLVITRAKGAVSTFSGWVDRDTVAQAADNAAV
jgi:hypothetical protein